MAWTSVFDLSVGHRLRCLPTGEQLQGVRIGASNDGGVDQQSQTVIGRKIHRLEMEVEGADHRVVEVFQAGVVVANILRRPSDPKLVAAGRELPDELTQTPVEGITPRFRSQNGNDVVSGTVPFRVKPALLTRARFSRSAHQHASEVKQMLVFCLVQLQRTRQSI